MANEVLLGISIRADGSVAVKQIGDVKKSVSGLGESSVSTFDRLKEHWLAATAVIYGSLKTIQTGWNLADSAARTQERMASLDALAARYGTSSQQIVDRIGQVSSGLIGAAAASEVAAQSLTKNLQPDQIYQLAQAAETLSNVTGKTAADSFRELSAAVALGRERAMEGSAGAIDLRTRYGELASMVSEAQRRQWMYNEVIARANELKRQGVGADDSAADKLERFSNTVEGAKLRVGDFLLGAVVPLAQGMGWGIQVAQQHEAAIKAAAVAVGVFAAGHFLHAAGASAVLAANFISVGQAARFLLFSGLNLLMNPLTWIIVAVGALAYAWIKLGQGTAEARAALDQYRASIAALNAQQRAEELSKQKAYIAELTAYIQQKKDELAKGPTFNPFADAQKAAYVDEAERLKAGAEARIKALSAAPAPFQTPADTGYSERLKRLEDMEREYLNRKELAQAGELDRELVQLGHWYNEQHRTLQRLAADDRQYSMLNEAYTEQHVMLRAARAAKIAEIEVAAWQKKEEDKHALERAYAEASISAQERAVQQRTAIDQLAEQAGAITASEGIRRRHEGERQLLELQGQRVLLSYEEGMSEEKFLVLLSEYARLQAQITENKRMEAEELDYRRLELQREITELSRQQAELQQQQQLDRAKDALGKIGGGEFAQSMGEVYGLAQGMEAGVAQGEDRYSQEYQAWAALQDQKIMKMEEIGAAEAEIKEAYRQYDLQAEAAAQQQKIAMAAGGFGMMANLANAFYQASGGKSKEAFAVMKAMRIGETVMNTYSAAVGAYNAMASIPYVGPALGVAAAAAAIAFGMAQVRAIASSQPGGGAASVSVGGTAGGVPALPSSSAPALPASQQEKPAPQINVNVHLYGDGIFDQAALNGFARQLAEPLQKAYEDGAR